MWNLKEFEFIKAEGRILAARSWGLGLIERYDLRSQSFSYAG